MGGMDTLIQYLPVLAPIFIIQIVLLLIGLYDLFQEDRRVRWFSKRVWALIIFFVNIIGPLAYFFVGREDV